MLTRREFLAFSGSAAAAGALGGLPLALPAKEDLLPTEKNIEGPFYREGAPFRTALAEKAKGDPLSISGRILAPDGKAIEGALVDVWHADSTGNYDNEGKEFLCRGRMSADKEGRYAFDTVMPAPYDLDGYGPREDHRPSHVHYKVSAKGFAPLTTQLYFKGDKHIAKDPFVRKSLVIPLEKGKGVFDIVLARKK